MTEVDLCARLRAWLESMRLVVYPEVEGWDLVAVASEPLTVDGRHLESGHQIGIHAKLRANVDVIAQAMTDRLSRGPHLAFVAVPVATQAFVEVARGCGLGAISLYATNQFRRKREVLSGPGSPRFHSWSHPNRLQRLTLPSIASRAISAGAPSPRCLSPWRENALRFLAFARARFTVTLADVRAHGMNAQTWSEKWLERVSKNGRVSLYKLRTDVELTDVGYEAVAAELAAADAAKGVA